MAKIDEIIDIQNKAPQDIISELKQKSVDVPTWGGEKGLEVEYDPRLHPVMNRQTYPDRPNEDGTGIERVTRIPLNFQKLASKRMAELLTGIPVKRVYKPESERQKEVAEYMEKIFERINIDDINNQRANMLYAGCEVMTLWFAQESPNNLYGFDSPIKMRCRNFSPMLGDMLYPLFDEYGDLIALSVEYRRKVGKEAITYFDTYTANRHIKWSDEHKESGWAVVEDETNMLGKIPAVYIWRPEPVWEHTSPMVYEMEWALSRNGNYLRKNSKPIFYVAGDAEIPFGEEKNQDEEFRTIVQIPSDGKLGYATWEQATDSLKFHTSELRQLYFTQLQLPDWSYEKMSQQALSGESRKQLFIDAKLKVGDESGAWRKFYDREINVLRTFLIAMLGESYRNDIEALVVKVEITPFSINDEKDTIDCLMSANGGRPLMSHRESIERYGHSTDVDKTMAEIEDDETRQLEEPTI